MPKSGSRKGKAMDSERHFRERLRRQRIRRRNQIIRRVSLFSVCIIAAVSALLYTLTRQSGPPAPKDQEAKSAHTWKITQYADTSGSQACIYTVSRDDGKLAVIDGGWDTNADALREIIASLGNHIDAWILTHPHKDHIGAFNVIYPDLQEITIDTILTIDLDVELYLKNAKEWDDASTEEEFDRMVPDMENLTYVHAGDILDLIGLKMTVINAYDDTVAEKSNDICNDGALAFKLEGSDTSMLFLSDVGSSMEDTITEKYGDELSSDYVSMAHHGNSSFSDAFYEKVRPRAAFFDAPGWLISGAEYTTSHFISLMEEMGAEIYTWEDAPHSVTLS